MGSRTKICFVILHYKTIDDTKTCVDSILKLDCKDYCIIVIDNGSNDGSGELLEDQYKENGSIRIIILKDNLGFSKGNNYGYSIAKAMDPMFMVVCNSDIIFTQSNFVEIIESIYNEYHYGVLGPDIYIPEYKFHSNPIGEKPDDIKRLRNLLIKKQNQLRHLKVTCLADRIYEMKRSLTLIIKQLFRYERTASSAANNMLLQGACYILGKEYLSKQNELFFPSDSFYYEEYFLYKRCLDNNILMRYDPKAYVIHTGSSATKKTMKSRVAKKRFVLENQIQSICTYIKECEKENAKQ